MKRNSRNATKTTISAPTKSRAHKPLASTSKLSGLLTTVGAAPSRSLSSSPLSINVKNSLSANTSPVTVPSRGYIAKHTHFFTWKPEAKPSMKMKEFKAMRDAVRIFSKEQFDRTRKPFDTPVISKLPLNQRKQRGKQILDAVNAEELTRLQQLPREIDDFDVGDQVAVTALLSMTENKTQVYKGTVIESTRKRGLHGRFTVRNNSDGGFYEVTFPFWSPFLRKIELIQKDPEPLVGKTKQAMYHRNLPADHPKNKVL